MLTSRVKTNKQKTSHLNLNISMSAQGPLSVFSAKQRWTAPRTIQLRPEDRDLGFTLKGESPVQVVSLDPLCPAAVSSTVFFYCHSTVAVSVSQVNFGFDECQYCNRNSWVWYKMIGILPWASIYMNRIFLMFYKAILLYVSENTNVWIAIIKSWFTLILISVPRHAFAISWK